MDRIAALRNVEEAIAAFEDGEATLAETERQVVATLRTYATEFGTDGLAAYRVTGVEEAVVVVADAPGSARERASTFGVDPIEVDRVE